MTDKPDETMPKWGKAHPTEVSILDLILERDTLRSELYTLRARYDHDRETREQYVTNVGGAIGVLRKLGYTAVAEDLEDLLAYLKGEPT